MRKKSIGILAAIALAAAAAALWWREGPVPVTLVSPSRGPAVEAIYATGAVEPSVMLPIAPRVGGRIVELNVDEGSRVKSGQVLARLDDMDLVRTIEELEARERYASSQFERAQQLVRQGFTAKAELDRTRAELDAAQAALKRGHALRDFMVLRPPADGLIIRRDGEVGQFIPAGQTVFYLSCCAPLRVTAEVDEEDIPRVHVGQKVVLRGDALPGEVFDGKVSEITPKGDPVARSYRVRIRLANPGKLQVGMTVDANLVVAQRENALLVPATALQDKTVWLVEEGRLRRQPVRTGVVGSGRAEILEGLTLESRIVDSPSDDLREGRAVRIRSPSEAADAARKAAKK
jgi:RND family efflux transporter MFP subunit